MSDNGENQERDYFESAYRDYEKQNPKRKLDHYLATLEARIGEKPIHLLDIGLGQGAFLDGVAQAHPDWSLSGFDPHPGAVRLAQERIPSARLHTGTIENSPFRGEGFDVITAWDVLEHVPDLAIARESVLGLLRPQGIFAFVVPVYDGLTGPLIKRLDKDETHIHKESRWFWVDWARSFVDDVQWHGIFRYLVAGSFYVHAPTRRFRSLAPAVLVTAIAG